MACPVKVLESLTVNVRCLPYEEPGKTCRLILLDGEHSEGHSDKGIEMLSIKLPQSRQIGDTHQGASVSVSHLQQSTQRLAQTCQIDKVLGKYVKNGERCSCGSGSGKITQRPHRIEIAQRGEVEKVLVAKQRSLGTDFVSVQGNSDAKRDRLSSFYANRSFVLRHELILDTRALAEWRSLGIDTRLKSDAGINFEETTREGAKPHEIFDGPRKSLSRVASLSKSRELSPQVMKTGYQKESPYLKVAVQRARMTPATCRAPVFSFSQRSSTRKRTPIRKEGPGRSPRLKKDEESSTLQSTLNRHTFPKQKAKPAFSNVKQKLAESFLAELDEVITKRKISRLTASTNGVRIVWSKRLRTTAGRAKLKREAFRSSSKDAVDHPLPLMYRYHATIELAENIVDDENRLLCVLAHEFCHIANFMISDITSSRLAHGRGFQAWAQECSHHFQSRGVLVTTTHSYLVNGKE